MIKTIRTALIFALTITVMTAQSRTLPQILQDGLASAPDLAEARANERIAGSRLDQTEAARWPVVSITGGQRLLTTNQSNAKSFVPTLRSSWTIYDFGQNEAATERDKLTVDYYNHKTSETAEELIYQLSGYYLEAFKAKMSLDVANDNKQRHEEIVRMLNIIVEYDPGRRFELTQAKSRLLQVESDLTNYQRSLGLSLLRLARYVEPAVTVGELQDPFSKMNVTDVVSRYSTAEEDLRTHPSYIAQQKELASITADLTAAERARWPTLNLVGEASEDETAVYMSFNVDVFNKAVPPGISEKQHQIEAAQALLRKILRDLRERARLAELKMFQDQSRLFIADNQIKELTQVAKDYEDQFSIAQRSLLDVVNAYRELASIDLFKVETNYDLMQAKLDYLSAVGGLREWAGIGKKGGKPDRDGKMLETIDFEAEAAARTKSDDTVVKPQSTAVKTAVKPVTISLESSNDLSDDLTADFGDLSEKSPENPSDNLTKDLIPNTTAPPSHLIELQSIDD